MVIEMDLSEVSEDLGGHAQAEAARVAAAIDQVSALDPVPPWAPDYLAAMAEELAAWRAALALYSAAATPPAPPCRAVVLHQVYEAGRWWCVRRYAAANFHRQTGAAMWGERQLAALRARPFPPRERHGATRLVAEVWATPPALDVPAAPATIIY